MKILKITGLWIKRKCASLWRKMNEFDHEAYLRDRHFREERERARIRSIYFRGWL